MSSTHRSNGRTTTSTTQLESNFTRRFLRSLRPLSPPNTNAAGGLIIRRRSLRIKRAAYSSMARAAGSHRAWTRALLSRTTSRRRLGVHLKKNVVVVRSQRREPSRAGKLRELVPGGSRMGTCELLEETAHYVECLAVQVRVMQAVADYYSIRNNC